MSHDTVSADVAVARDGWAPLVGRVPPRSPQLSAFGDIAYVGTEDAADSAGCRTDGAANDSTERSCSPSTFRRAFFSASHGTLRLRRHRQRQRRKQGQ